MRILVAPDKFKASLDAVRVAQSIADGATRVFPDAYIDLVPLADGGEGTGRALLAAIGGRTEAVEVTGPLGRIVAADLVLLDDGRAVVETASASGLALLDETERDALAASSVGTGELVCAALDRGARDVVVAVGGTASSDGGTGAAAAVGWRFLDDGDRVLPRGGGELRRLERIDATGVDPRVDNVSIIGACDVDNPLIGETGAAAVFGPQKGADASDVAMLEQALHRLAEVVRADLGVDVGNRPGAGAGGGMGAGLIAFFGAQLESGFDIVAGAARLGAAVRAADLVVTGEGRLDDGSLGGKAPVAVARLAAADGTPCVVVAGDVRLGRDQLTAAGFSAATGLLQVVGEGRAFEDPAGAIADATERLLAEGTRSH